MQKIMRIFVQIPFKSQLVELHNTDTIFNKPCYDWINTHNIEDYKFLDVAYGEAIYKLPISDFKFMY
ncbi:MAG: hypothetical protein IKF38_05020 [Clostridia bacterium]|nr:hypothetical protein [Clostridia bacterium]